MKQKNSRFGRFICLWLLMIFTLGGGVFAFWAAEAVAQELDPKNVKLSHEPSESEDIVMRESELSRLTFFQGQ
ncbi:MAG: hypothetical protein AAGD96_06015 [Chloroflexota bacterium]